MGLYDEDYMPEKDDGEIIEPKIKKGKGKIPSPKKFDFNFSRNMKAYLITVLIALIVIVGFYAIYLYAQPSFVDVEFKDNPLVLSEAISTKLYVTIANSEEKAMKNLVVTVKPYDNLSLVVIPSESQEIYILGPDEKRILEYDVSVAGTVLNGDYSVEVKVKNSKTEYVMYETITISQE